MRPNNIPIIAFILILLLNIYNSKIAARPLNKSQEAIQIEHFLNQSYQFAQDKEFKDSALIYLDKALNMFPQLKNDWDFFDIYSKLAKLYNNIWNYSIAIEFHFKALDKLDEIKKKQGTDLELLKKYDIVYYNIAECFLFEDAEKAKKYMKINLSVLNKIKETDASVKELNENYVGTYNLLGNIYLTTHQTDSAFYYYNMALSLDSINPNSDIKSSIYNNLGIINWEKGEYDKSEFFFNKSFEINPNSSIYFNLGRNHFLQKEYDQAEKFLKQAIIKSKTEKNIDIEYRATWHLSQIYRIKKSYGKSLNLMDSTLALQEKITDMEKEQAGIAIEMKYLFNKQKNTLEAQIAEKEKRILIYILTITVLIFTTGVILLLYRSQKIKAHNSKIEQENLELKNRQLQIDLKQKEKEKDMYAQYLLNHNEHIRSATEKVSKLSGKKEEIAEAMKEFETNIEKSVWNEFKILFQNLHSDFYENLYNAHPNLSLNEKRICVFIKLNMTSKEISAITGQQVRAIEVARTRLRVKLGLKRSENLNAYLQQF